MNTKKYPKLGLDKLLAIGIYYLVRANYALFFNFQPINPSGQVRDVSTGMVGTKDSSVEMPGFLNLRGELSKS